jgi:mannose/fructose/sorbose-specific phosphotransferase system IIA component
MVGIIAVSHGLYAKALIRTVEMVYGKQDKIKAICLEQGESMESLQNKISMAIKKLETKEVLILVDLLGGTPYNVSSIGLDNSDMNVITGLNMPMILEILPFRNESLEKISFLATEAGKNGIINVKEKFEILNKLKDSNG